MLGAGSLESSTRENTCGSFDESLLLVVTQIRFFPRVPDVRWRIGGKVEPRFGVASDFEMETYKMKVGGEDRRTSVA